MTFFYTIILWQYNWTNHYPIFYNDFLDFVRYIYDIFEIPQKSANFLILSSKKLISFTTVWLLSQLPKNWNKMFIEMTIIAHSNKVIRKVLKTDFLYHMSDWVFHFPYKDERLHYFTLSLKKLRWILANDQIYNMRLLVIIKYFNE